MVTPTFTGTVPIPSLQFSFLGENFNQTAAATSPLAAFDNGNFLGWNFAVDNAFSGSAMVNFSFAFIPGTNDTLDSFFSYSTSLGDGAGDANYTLVPTANVPEPSLIFALLGVGIFAVSRLHQHSGTR